MAKKLDKRFDKRILLIIIGVVIIVGALSYYFVFREPMKDYNKQGWRVEYPDNWILQENTNGFYLFFRDQSGGNLGVLSEPTEFSDINRYASFFENNIREGFPDVKFVSTKEINIGNAVGREVVYDPNDESRVLQAYTIQNGRGTLITYSALKHIFDENVDDVRKVIGSIKIGDLV